MIAITIKLSVLLILYACLFDNKTAGTNTETETGNGIQLTGRVLNYEGLPIPGIIAHLIGKDLFDTTNATGRYHFNINPGRTPLLKVNADSVLDKIEFINQGQKFTSIEVYQWVDTLPDVIFIQREFSGTLLDSSGNVGKIEAVLYTLNDSVPDPLTKELYFNKQNSRFSGFVFFLPDLFKKEYAAYVNVYDTAGKFIARSDTLFFNSLAGNLVLNAFVPDNGLPTAYAGGDTALSIKDSLFLNGSGTDLFGGFVTRYFWNIGPGNAFAEVSEGDTTIVLPAEENAGYALILKVVDDHGHSDFDTLIVNVLKDVPDVKLSLNTANPKFELSLDTNATKGTNINLTRNSNPPGSLFSKPDTIWLLALSDSLKLKGEISQEFGTISAIGWRINQSDYKFTSLPDTAFIPESEGVLNIVLKVEDDDGNLGHDSLKIKVIKDTPTAKLTVSSSVRADSAFQVSFKESRPGIFATMTSYQFGIGGIGSLRPALLKDTLLAGSPLDGDSLTLYLKVTNNYGHSSLDSQVVRFYRDWDPLIYGGSKPEKPGSFNYVFVEDVLYFLSTAQFKKVAGGNWVDLPLPKQGLGIVNPFDYLPLIEYKNEIYVALPDDSGKIKFAIQKFDGTGWEYIGARGVLPMDMSFEIDTSTNDIYVCEQMYSNTSYIFKLVGDTWVSIADSTLPEKFCGGASISANNGKLYLVFTDCSTNRLKLFQYANSAWTAIDCKELDHRFGPYSWLAKGGKVYIVIDSSSGTAADKLLVLDNGQWEVSTIPSTEKYSNLNMALTGSELFVSFRSNQDIKILRYNGVEWSQAGKPISTKEPYSMNKQILLRSYNNKTYAISLANSRPIIRVFR